MGKIRELLGLGKVRRSKLDDDETEDIIRQIEREEARRLRLAKIREYRLEAEGRLKELERKLREMEEGGRSNTIQEKFGSLIITPADVEAAKAIAKLPEAEQQRIIGILTALKTPAEKMGMGLNPLTALVLANLTKGGTPEDVTSRVLKDMKAFKEVMGGGKGNDLGSTLAGLAEIIKVLKPEKSSESSLAEKLALEYIKTLGEVAKNKKGWLEEVLEDPKKLEAIKTILGASGQTSPEVMEILRRMEMDRRRWDLALKKLEWEKELKEKQLMAERLRAKEISNGIKKAIGAAAGALTEVPKVVRRAPEEMEESSEMSSGEPEMETVICDKCGTEIPVAPDAVEIICPGCGQRYRRGEVGGGKAEEKGQAG